MVKRQKFVNTWRELIGVMEQQLRLASNALWAICQMTMSLPVSSVPWLLTGLGSCMNW
jgi:hypothetical protein